MLELKKDDFDENLEDIMSSIENLLNKTGNGYEMKKEEDKKD